MINERLNDLTFMFSYITGVSFREAEKIILSTNTGKRIENRNSAALYEQQTENLYQITQELKGNHICPQLEDTMTVKNIVQAFAALIEEKEKNQHPFARENCKFEKKPALKSLQRKWQKLERKKQLQIKRQNRINVRRIEDAIGIEK